MSTLRGYLTDAQYTKITDSPNVGDAAISKAEAIIDGYLGTWVPFFNVHWRGAIRADGNARLVSEEHARMLDGVNQLKGLVIEFLTGAHEGKFFIINASEVNGTIELVEPPEEAPSAGDVYHIYQMGKVPRRGEDDYTTFISDGQKWYARSIPTALKEAVAYQVAYMKELGQDYFDGNAMNMTGESFGSYSYTKAPGAAGAKALVAPKARQVLANSGLINRTANIVGY